MTQTSHTIKETFAQALRYGAVGITSAAIELVIFQVLSAVVHVALAWSNIIAVVLSTTFNFIASRKLTFKSTANPVRSLVLYLLLFAFNTTFTTTGISLLSSWGVYPLLAKIATMACVVLWNFVLYKKVIFPPAPQAAPAPPTAPATSDAAPASQSPEQSIKPTARP